MNCIHCDRDAFNRLVVDPATGERRGGLCEDCERSTFGVLASEPLWCQDDGCGLCPGPADVALPELDCLVEWNDGREEVEFTVTDGTMHLCADHLAACLDADEPAPASPVESRA